MNAYIISFNRLTPTKAMAEYLADHGIEVVIVDNCSTYQPLLDWLETCPHKVHRLPKVTENHHKTPWTFGVIYPKESHYLVTDHDLDLSNIPSDFLEVLFTGLENQSVIKAGFSLELEDLPRNEYTHKVAKYESKFWQAPKDVNGFYLADIDTTFALYDAERTRANFETGFFKAVRAPRPYTARHLPWYNTPENLSEEEKFYLNSIGNTGHWCHEYKRQYGAV